MKRILQLRVNGEDYEVAAEPHQRLSRVLREELNLTGLKEGCLSGECGSCTVLIDGQLTLSCCTLAVSQEHRSILTIEGLAEGDRLHPLQQAFIDYGAVQCGFCIPGMILTAKALLDENPSPTREDVELAISGNLCRCTGYIKIVDAVLATAEAIRKGGR